MKHLKRLKPPYPTFIYIGGLVLAGLLAFGLLANTMLSKMELIKTAVQQDNHHAAQQEMKKAIGAVFKVADKLGSELTTWDEVHQQLASPIYYAYWRLRLVHSEQFPGYVKSVELYGPDAKSLIKDRYMEMPAQVPHKRRYLSFGCTGICGGVGTGKMKDQLFIYWFVPIEARDATGNLAGYVGLKIDFMEALHTLNQFLYTDMDSIELNTKVSDDDIDPDNIMSVLHFHAMGNPASSQLEKTVVNTLKQAAVLVIVVMFIFYAIVVFLFSSPLRRLEQYIDAMRLGKPEAPEAKLDKSLPILEMEKLRRSIDCYQEELNEVHARLDRQNEELWIQAHKDPLTGAYNRRAFDKDWRELQNVLKDQRMNISFMLFDCDFFKVINDTYGHDAGDLVIKGLAKTLKSVLRKGDKLYRMGGDEFATVLINSDATQAETIANRCLEAVRNYPFAETGVKEPIKLSVGISQLDGSSAASICDLPKQADLAMYRAKGTARQKIVHFKPELDNFISNEKIAAILQAIETGECVEMHYQPVVKASSGKIDYYEALLRLRNDDGLIGPAEIFPIIEKRAMEVELDLAVIKRIHLDLCSGMIPLGTGVSINLSGTALSFPDFCDHLGVFDEFLQSHHIVIEVTETTLITQLQKVSECLNTLRQRGFTIALDDFGSGYSSIRYLANMPIDIVKFDITMIQDLNKDTRTRMIIKNTANMILGAGFQLVAEGIETEELKAKVITMGATHLQGFLLGRPGVLTTTQASDLGYKSDAMHTGTHFQPC